MSIFPIRRTFFYVCLLLLLCLSNSLWGSPERVLHGQMPSVVTGLMPLSSLESTTRLDLVISLPLRHPAALTNLLNELYDPASLNYHRFLTPEQFTEKFGPTEEDYNALIAFAEGHHFQVTGKHANRMLITVNAAAADIEKSLGVELHRYRHPTEARTFFAPDREPTLDFDRPILEISGLDDFSLPQPAGLQAMQTPHPEAGSGSGGTYVGDDFRAAYVPGVTLTGAGQNVGMLEFNGYYTNDINAYKAIANRTNQVTTILTDSFNGVPTAGTSEESLDIDMAMAMAPAAGILVYEGNSGSVILSRMASDNTAKQISCSWTFPVNATSEQALQQFALQGQSFFQASGDHKATVGAAYAPEDNPYATVTGGTELSTTGPKGAWTAEKVWNSSATSGSSGGASTVFTIPIWQEGIDMTAAQGSGTMRNTPDVAMAADQLFVVADNGTNVILAGTSAAAPQWAGFMALVNQQASLLGQPAIGFANPAIYEIARGSNYSRCFHDITVGNNTNAASPTQYFAVTGYDLCTGWGTPTGSNLVNALVNAHNYSALVANGSFEDGNFTSWNFTGNTAQAYVSVNTNYIHGGIDGARLQQIGSVGQLSQAITTVTGEAYLISFWLANPTNGTPNQFIATWNGATLMARTNLAAFAFTNFEFMVRATSAQSTLSFQFRNDAAPFGLDDVAVAALPAPDVQSLTRSTNALSFSWSSLSGLIYQIQYSPSLNPPVWTNLGPQTMADGSTTSIQETGLTNASGFYRIELLPY